MMKEKDTSFLFSVCHLFSKNAKSIDNGFCNSTVALIRGFIASDCTNDQVSISRGFNSTLTFPGNFKSPIVSENKYINILQYYNRNKNKNIIYLQGN